MFKQLIMAGLASATIITICPAMAQTLLQRIPRSQIDLMFADMKANTPWDLSGKLLWGYYFTASDKLTLEVAARSLVDEGYRLVDLSRPLDDHGQPIRGSWRLHMERVEHHTPESLFLRNSELYDFASRQGLASYDGMDVGPVK